MSEKIEIEQFLKDGYFISKKLIPEEFCQNLLKAIENEVKPYKGELTRVSTAQKEVHYISDNGFITNPILDIHEFEHDPFRKSGKNALNILSSSALINSVKEIIDDSPVLVQSGYFESSMGSVPHFDSFFFNSIHGTLLGCWIALEDIHPKVGSFYIYPKSHLLGTEGAFDQNTCSMFYEYERLATRIIRHPQDKNSGLVITDIARSRKLLNKIISNSGLSPLAFDLKTGDVILFSSKLLHGSHESFSSGKSRNSLIGHFTPLTKGFNRYGQTEPLSPEKINGLYVQCINQSQQQG